MNSNVSSESSDLAEALAPPTPSAGAQLRAHREAQGLSDEALAQTLRMPIAKLRALESDQFEALPDAMFARALALAVCRHLQVDPAPVLASLPERDVSRLAARDERGIDSPLQRPSLLASSRLPLATLFQMRWLIAVPVLVVLGYAFTQWRSADVEAVDVTQPAAPSAVAPSAAPTEVTQPVVVTTPVTTPAPAVPAQAVPSPAPATTQTDHLVVTPVQTTPIVLAPMAPATPATPASAPAK